jgi:DNA-binding beta-propeller fold protein YncE
MTSVPPLVRRLLWLAILAPIGLHAARADAPDGLLPRIRHQTLLTPTVPDNGDQNPYAIVVAPVGRGVIQKNDVLITNFNDENNLQGLGTTIVRYAPSTGRMSQFAKLPRHLASCPGGIGFTTAMTMLKTGWVIVGSTPSNDGMPRTKGAGCLLVLDSNGTLVDSWSGPDINGPWGNMAVIDNGDKATLFVSNAGFGTDAATKIDPETGHPTIAYKATVLRLELSIPNGGKPVIVGRTVIADGFGERGDASVFLIGPTGLALGADGSTLYVSDAIGNRITAIPDAPTRHDSAGTGRVVTQDQLLQRPLAMVLAPNGHLLVTNGLNGQVVEIDPLAGKQLYARWVDANKAQSPPGSGDLFGIAVAPDGTGFYFVEDEINSLMLAH